MACLRKKRRNHGRRTLLQQRIDIMNGDMQQRLLLSHLPTEVIHTIAKMLPATSVVTLSQSCRKIRAQLSKEQGNRLYYELLPPALLMAEEVTMKEEEDTMEEGHMMLDDDGQFG